MVGKLKTKLANSRKSAKRKLEKRESRAHLTTLAAGALMGAVNRKGIELPMAGEVGSATVLAASLYAAGMYLKNDTLADLGAAVGAIAVHEFVEDSPMLDGVLGAAE